MKRTIFATVLACVFAALAFGCAPDPADTATVHYAYTLPEGVTASAVTGALPADATVQKGATVTVNFGDFAIAGYAVDGATDGTRVYAAGDSVTVTEDLTLTLVLSKRSDTATVHYAYTLPEGVTASAVTGALPADATVQKGATVTVSFGDFAIAGCRVLGATASADALLHVGDALPVTEDTTLTLVIGVPYRFGSDTAYAGDGWAAFRYGTDREVRLSGDSADFSDGAARYRIVFDAASGTATLKTHMTAQNEYAEATRAGASLTGRYMTLAADGTATFRIEGMDGVWGSGAYEPIPDCEGEYRMTIDPDSGAYGIPSEFRFRLTTIDREEGYVCDVYLVWDGDGVGEYTPEDGGADRLTLDGYGFATYVVGGRTVRAGSELRRYEKIDAVWYAAVPVDGVTVLFRLGANFRYAIVDPYIGTYRRFFVAEQTTGLQEISLDGCGGFLLRCAQTLYGAADTVVADGDYASIDGDEIRIERIGFVSGADADTRAQFAVGARLRLAELDFGGVADTYCLLYDTALTGEYTAQNGAKLTLDGYGYGTLTEDGASAFEGFAQKSGDIVELSGSGVHRFFRVDGGAFVECGAEIGNYFLFDPLTGLDVGSVLYFDGGGTVERRAPRADGGAYETLDTGSYAALGDDKWQVTFDGDSFAVGLGMRDFGTTESDVRYIYAIYHAEWDGDFAAGGNVLTLDGMGLAGAYTAGEYVYEGEFVCIDGVVTLWCSSPNEARFVFALDTDADTCERLDASCGTHYYVPESLLMTWSKVLTVRGDGSALLDEDGVATRGTVTDLGGDVYRFSADDRTFEFMIQERGALTGIVLKDETRAGVYEGAAAFGSVTLDGFGNVLIDGERIEAQLCGTKATVVTFEYDRVTHTLWLDKENMRYETAAAEAGYHYLCEDDTISMADDRLFLDGKGSAELCGFDETTSTYVLLASGTYARSGEQYVFTPDGAGDAFFFVLFEREGYPVWQRNESGELPDEIGTYTRVLVGNVETLVLNPDGSAWFSYWNSTNKTMQDFDGSYTIENTPEGTVVHFTGGPYGVINYDITIDVATKTILGHQNVGSGR